MSSSIFIPRKRKAAAESPPSKKARVEADSGPQEPFLAYTHSPPRRPPAFQLPTNLITFSYTPARELEFDDSAKRYYVPPPLGAQLSHGYDRWIRRPEEKPRIDSLLRAYVEKKKRRDSEVSLEDVGVICWRGVLTRILTAPYEERDGWEMNVMLWKGTLYFEEHLTDEKIEAKNNIEGRQLMQTYYGYAFESYCTSDTPTRDPGWGGDVDTNVQWCNVVRTKLGEVRMVIGGEVDCVRGEQLVELKTSLNTRNAQDEGRFEKKLLKFYFQSFLLGVPEIVVGFRTPSGEITRLEELKTIEIPRRVRGKRDAWDPNVCLGWGQEFLTFLKGVVVGEGVWRVRFVPKEGVKVEAVEMNDADRVGILPRWYIDL